MRSKLLFIALLLVSSLQLFSQENYKTISKSDSVKIYTGGKPYEVKTFTQKFKSKNPKT